MKKATILLVFFTLSSLVTLAQKSSKIEKQFLEWFFIKNLKIKDDHILYVSKSSVYTIKEMKKYFDKDTLTGLILSRKITVAPQIIYTKNERKYVVRKIEKLETETLPDNILPFAKIISSDTLNHIFNDRTKGWNYAYKKGIKGYYHFTKPIFFRNGTLCIFDYGYGCGNLCGYGNTSVYKKTEDGWILCLQLDNWIS
ncbi:hypothetical protein CA265_25190 [Sphingobacteriaceae bacterium GW460-11-11-14-LB5]|nr:hypothetical protein CA265_25190 [Sphingobacteriaceae bacterium GW460-11-11-14-LB5]